MSQQKEPYDIAIIGGGMVGISLALLLAQQKRWKVLVLESQSIHQGEIPQYSPSFDARSTALSWSSRCIFEKLGVWQKIQQHAQSIATIHVSDRGHMGLTRLQAQEAGVEALGYVVENSWLGSVLMQQLAQTDIELIGDAKIQTIQPKADAMQLTATLENQEVEINTRLLVVADGADSASAKLLGIQTQKKDYGHSAIIANLSLEAAHQAVAYERFTDQGPMALLPLADYKNTPRSALVWTQPNHQAEELMEADDSTFINQLQTRFGDRLGQFSQVGERISYPLTQTLSEEQVRRRLVIAGNAAHSLHPVAGQGFNLSLRDMESLVNGLVRQPIDADVGALETLLSYQDQRTQDQRNTLLFTNGLSKLFGLSSPAVALGRNSGLLMMDLVPSLRNQFAHFGMGTQQSGADYV
jgi:2-polyprenyl-6-methoxyphenol 4-hydroxylase